MVPVEYQVKKRTDQKIYQKMRFSDSKSLAKRELESNYCFIEGKKESTL
jgi:hypothetical protein